MNDDPRARRQPLSPPRLLRRLRAGEGGQSLIEMIVTMSIALTILAALLMLWTSAASDETVNAARYESIDDASRSLERMTREVRESVTVTPTSASVLNLKLWKRGLAAADTSALHQVEYDCARAGAVAGTFQCQRTDLTTGATELVLDGLSTSSVFSNAAGAPNLQIRLSLRVTSQNNPIVVSGGASPRNCTGALTSCS